MSKVENIVVAVEKESPGLLDAISREDGISKEDLVRKVLSISHGQMVCIHQNAAVAEERGVGADCETGRR